MFCPGGWRDRLTIKLFALTHWFVFDGGTGDTQVEFAVLLDAGVNQSLDRGLLLEEQEGVSWKRRQRQGSHTLLLHT